MDFNAFKRELLAHYVHMASLPWAREAALYSARELARRFTSEFGRLPDALAKELKKRTEEQK